MKKNNQILYNKIMDNISYSIKDILSENIENFDVTDYQENIEDIVNHNDIRNIVIKTPKNLEEEMDFFEKLEPSPESLKIIKSFIRKIQKILSPLKDKRNLKKVLPYFDKILEGDDFYLTADFMVISNFVQDYVADAYMYPDEPYIQFEQDLFNKNNFTFKSGIKDLAKMIEFCDLYKNPLNASIYIRGSRLYNAFKPTIKTKGASSDPQYIWPLNNIYLQPYTNTTEVLFEHICSIYKEFVEFILNEAKNNGY